MPGEERLARVGLQVRNRSEVTDGDDDEGGEHVVDGGEVKVVDLGDHDIAGFRVHRNPTRRCFEKDCRPKPAHKAALWRNVCREGWTKTA